MVGLCVVRATSNAYPTRNPELHSQYQLVINLWDKLNILSWMFKIQLHIGHPVMNIVKNWLNKSIYY